MRTKKGDEAKRENADPDGRRWEKLHGTPSTWSTCSRGGRRRRTLAQPRSRGFAFLSQPNKQISWRPSRKDPSSTRAAGRFRVCRPSPLGFLQGTSGDSVLFRRGSRSFEMSTDAHPGKVIVRHAAPVRITHWINVICMAFLLMSGLNIFNAHPNLYFGSASNFAHPSLSIGAKNEAHGPVGVTAIGGHSFTTTGVLGVSSSDGQPTARAFPRGSPSPAIMTSPPRAAGISCLRGCSLRMASSI